jgi:NTE family protein
MVFNSKSQSPRANAGAPQETSSRFSHAWIFAPEYGLAATAFAKMPDAIEEMTTMTSDPTPLDAVNAFRDATNGQVVLVMQGGGALGAYQGGVYEALHEAGIEPDWIIGTSIGAINASIICGNPVARRLDRLKEFWRRMERGSFWEGIPFWSDVALRITAFTTMASGIPGFFESNHQAFHGAENAGCYSTMPLYRTLTELVDFTLIGKSKPRLKMGVAQVRTSMMRYFDSRDMPIAVEHVMASGALPPAFPPVRIDGELYWDGGILSNTPTEAIFDDNPRRSALIFAAHMWHPSGPEPQSIFDVLHRFKDIQFSSRLNDHIARQLETHRLRQIISQLAKHVPQELRSTAAVREMAAYGCTTRMHIIPLLAPRLDNEDHMKEMDFSPLGIRARWRAGHADTCRALARAPWTGEFSPLEGVILHNLETESAAEPAVAKLSDAAE